MLATAIPWERCWIGCKVRTLLEDTVGAMLDRLRSQCIQGDTEAEVDGMNGNTLAALVVGRAELDRDTVNSAAGRERGGWDEREHGGSAGSGESGAG